MQENKLFIPISIIISGLIIVGAVMFTKRSGTEGTPIVTENTNIQELAVKPVTDDDHILGSPEADIFIVEYSDFECPFCSNFHATMKDVMSSYGGEGKVAWIFRQLPLEQIHKDARPAAIASECVAEIAGNDAFWGFADAVFENQEENLSAEGLKNVALGLGVTSEAYDACITGESAKNAVDADLADAQLIQQTDPDNFGTPYNIITTKDGVITSFTGARPYQYVSSLIDAILLKEGEKVEEVENTENVEN